MSRSAVTFLTLILLCLQSEITVKAQSPQQAKPAGFAVVELFTSQGCSSCPPADDFLRQLDQLAQETDLDIVPLSFHVDYWNRLGWKDPFSAAAYSNRQRQYAAHWNSRRIYTPQMIVNGAEEFVGSNQKEGSSKIASALRQSPRASIRILKTRPVNNRLNVDYQISGVKSGDQIQFALVQNPQVTAVRRGENSGRRLAHVNVVRAFRTVPASALSATTTGQQTSLAIPTGVQPSDVKVIAYVQEETSFRIVGATISGREQASDPNRRSSVTTSQ